MTWRMWKRHGVGDGLSDKDWAGLKAAAGHGCCTAETLGGEMWGRCAAGTGCVSPVTEAWCLNAFPLALQLLLFNAVV